MAVFLLSNSLPEARLFAKYSLLYLLINGDSRSPPSSLDLSGPQIGLIMGNVIDSSVLVDANVGCGLILVLL